MTLPTLKVLLDNGTGTFPFDISRYVKAAEGYQIKRGREDWQGAVTAGDLTLTLNNSDGRFTPGSTIIATPSPITVDQRIRVIEDTGVGGGFDVGGFDVGGFDSSSGFSRFTGYVKAWPVAWPATVTTFATVDVSATDAQARAERRTLRSMLEEEVLLDAPSGFWPLSEAEGALAGGALSVGTPTLAPTSTGASFGATIGLPDGNTGVTLTGVTRLSSALTGSLSTLHLEFEFLTSDTNTGLAQIDVPTLSFRAQVFLSSGRLWFSGGGLGGNSDTGVTPAPGLPHVVSLEVGDGAAWLWLDGIRISGALPNHADFDLSTLLFGAGTGGTIPTGVTIGMVNVGLKLSDARVQAHHSAALTQFAGESATARITRLASYAGLTLGALDTSLVRMPAQLTGGVSAWSAMQDVADAAFGVAYIDSTGALAFHDGTRVPAKTTPDLTLTSQWVTPDVVPIVDDQQIVNYVEATSAGSGATQVARNQTSETAHGRYPESADYLVRTDQEALDRANWTVANFAEPTARFGTLTINLYGMSATQATTVLRALDLDCWLRVSMLAAQTPGGTVADMVVQGWQATATAESWTITCNVVGRALYNAFIADDPVFGLADATVARAFI